MATEKRLIDANDAEKFAREHILDAKERFLILDFLRECSTVDAVEVVRCKDCCHYRKATDWDGNSYYACHKRAAVLIMETKADDFCSYGERRTDGNS